MATVLTWVETWNESRPVVTARQALWQTAHVPGKLTKRAGQSRVASKFQCGDFGFNLGTRFTFSDFCCVYHQFWTVVLTTDHPDDPSILECVFPYKLSDMSKFWKHDFDLGQRRHS